MNEDDEEFKMLVKNINVRKYKFLCTASSMADTKEIILYFYTIIL